MRSASVIESAEEQTDDGGAQKDREDCYVYPICGREPRHVRLMKCPEEEAEQQAAEQVALDVHCERTGDEPFSQMCRQQDTNIAARVRPLPVSLWRSELVGRVNE